MRCFALITSLFLVLLTACGSTTSAGPVPTAPGGGSVLYATTAPGPGCDKEGGLWQKSAMTTVTCTPTGTQIGSDYGADFGNVDLDGPPTVASLPTNYRLAFSVLLDQGSYGAGLRFGPAPEAYNALILIDGDGVPPLISTGTGNDPTLAPVPRGGTLFQIVVMVHGQSIQLSVNGRTLGSFMVAQSMNTRSITLTAGSGTARRPAYATFSNFVISTLR